MEIRNFYATGNYTQHELSRRFGVDQKLIWLIVNRKLWRHI